MLLFGFSLAKHQVIFISYLSELSYVMKKKLIGHISNVMSKCHNIFTENLTIFFKCRKAWKCAGIQI